MNLTKLSEPYREVLAIQEALCRLGFMTDDIYYQAGPYADPKQGVLQVILMVPGSPKFVIDAGLVSLAETERFETKFREIIRIINTRTAKSRKWREQIWKRSKIGSDSAYFLSLAIALAKKGIAVPNAPATPDMVDTISSVIQN